jgi:adenylate cyclase
VKDIYAGEPGFRRNLLEPLSDSDFPILHELREKGDTDYLIASLELSPGVFSYISCSTDRPGGFSDADIALWDELQVPLAATVADLSTRMALQSLLTTYLGAKAADCVLSGQFKRGDGQSMEAVVWFSDLRGFTAFADRHTTTEVMDRLNRYFDVVGTALEAHGGEILKFIGDGVLAVLPLVEERPASEVVMAALEAARWTVDTLTRTGAEDDTPFDVGIGLHAGRVTFGNVGTPRRLDFTTIGGPVNEAARIESLCKPLGHRVLVSKVVAELAQGVGLTSVGTHHLRGSRRPIELFRLDL